MVFRKYSNNCSRQQSDSFIFIFTGGWSGGAKVLGKLPVPGRLTNLDYNRARAYCACSRCGWGCLDIFILICPFSSLSPSLWATARYRLKYCLKGPLNLEQPTNHLFTEKIRINISVCTGISGKLSASQIMHMRQKALHCLVIHKSMSR